MNIGIFGHGGHAREVYWCLDFAQRVNCKFFVDDEYFQGGENILPISEFEPEEYQMIVAVADPKARKSIIDKLPSETKYYTFIHPTAQILGPDVWISEGCYIGPNSIVTTNITIGKHAILNRGNQIGHDCVIGDYFSAMPGAIVSGNVNIGNCVYIGSNTSIREKINISDNVVIGLNSGVVRDIKESGTYGGLPAEKIK